MNYLEEMGLEFKKIVGEANVSFNEEMKKHIYFKVGGPADILVIPQSVDEVKAVVCLCKENNTPYFIIGNGSNLLVKDGGVRGVVIKLSALKNIRVEGDCVIAESGVQLSEVSKVALESSLTGVEFACGIPGSVGGAVFMNAGAYDGEMSNIISRVTALDSNCDIVELDKDELELGYRTSIIMQKGYVVLSVELKLRKGTQEEIDNKILDLTKKREEKQPLEYPSAGSTFKRAPGYFTGKLIQDSGLKGYSIGGAAISEKHAGFIINRSNATAKDILNLIHHVQKTIKENYGVELEPEVRIIGEEN